MGLSEGTKKDIEAKKMQNSNGLDTFEGKFDSANCEYNNNNNTCRKQILRITVKPGNNPIKLGIHMMVKYSLLVIKTE